MRGELYRKRLSGLIAGYRGGRPVKWIEDRAKTWVLQIIHATLLADGNHPTADGNIGMRASVQGDMGRTYTANGGVVPSKAAQFLQGLIECHHTPVTFNS